MNRYIISILLVFALLSGIFYYINTSMHDLGYRFKVLMGGNIIMFLLSLTTYFLVTTQLSKKPQAFVRGVYSSSLLKLMVCMFAILIYTMINKPDIHKPTLFVLFGIYAVYSVVETVQLSKMARTK
ncbi:MAG: hypothetical protein JST82_16045 [Bacteroidetes bacterium]|nr:hypothetical protein [Bacteroidota bacterium]